MNVSIVIATAGRTTELMRLLSSIKKHTRGIGYEIVIVAPKNKELSVKAISLLSRLPCRLVWEDAPDGCVKAFNLGFRAARGRFIVHLNDDCEVTAGWLKNMLTLIGNRKVQGAFYLSEPDREGFLTNVIFEKLYANFGCMRRDLMGKLGFWDERFQHYGADPDFGLKVWHAGWEVVSDPSARILHYCVVDEHRREDLRSGAFDQILEKWQGVFC